MDWLNNWTSKWKLRNSFYFYISIHMVVGLILSAIFGLLFEQLRLSYIETFLKTGHDILLSKFVFSGVATFIYDIKIFLFLCISAGFGFSLFYRHKICNLINFIYNKEERDVINITNTDELSNSVIELVNEIEDREREGLKNTFYINHLLKKEDTLLHEIKNPLSTIKGDLEILNMMMGKEETVVEVIQRLTRNEERIENYLNKLNMTNTIQNIVVDTKTISIRDLWESIINNYKSDILTINYHEKILENADVLVDNNLFFEGLDNIVQNAKRFATQKIDISILEEEDTYILSVKDDGKGFSKEALDNYNKPYYSENTLSGNMGLGLYLTEQFFEKQGIKFSVENNMGAFIKIYIQKS